MDLEHNLTRMLEESVIDLNPPVDRIVTEANVYGRRLRRRRRLRNAAVTTVVASLAVTGAVIGLDRHGGGPPIAPAASGTATTSPSASTGAPTPTGAGTTPSVPVNGVQVTPSALLEILSELLPGEANLGNFDVSYSQSNVSSADMSVEYNDGHGASSMGVMLMRDNGRVPPITCDSFTGEDEATRPDGADPASCSVKTLADGSLVQSVVTGTGVSGLYDYNVRVHRPDGVTVLINAGTGTVRMGSIKHTRVRPPLGIPTLEAMVQSPKWQFIVPLDTVQAGDALVDSISHLE